MDNQKQIGIIKWFDKIKGYGVIITANDGEYFIHSSNIYEIPDKILVATPFVFEKGVQKGKKTALNCRIPSTKDDFFLALQLVGQNRTVEIEVEIKGKSRWGNTYVRREFKDYDILSYFFYKLLNSKSYNTVKEYFITGFNEIKQQEDTNKIIDYYKITKDRIEAIVFTDIPIIKSEQPENIDNIDEPFKKYELKKSPNDLLIEYLINFYNENSSNFIKFKVWQAGEYFTYSENLKNDIFGIHLGFDIKIEPPFNEKYFIEFANELLFDDFKRMKEFNISEVAQKKIIEYFIKDNYQTLDELKNAIGIINTFSTKPDFFDIIIKRISDDLYFQVWSSKKVYIDYEKKLFSLDFPFIKDFEIPTNILELKANEISINLLERISKFSLNKNDIISKILLAKLNNQIISSENILDFIKSISYLDIEYQINILNLFFNSYEIIDWEILIENKILNILPNSFGQILAYNFQINELLANKISNIISSSKIIDFQQKITLLFNLSKSHIITYVDKNRTEFTDKERLIIAQITKINDIIKLFLLDWKFENSYKTIELVELCAENSIGLNEIFKNKLEPILNNYSSEDLVRIYKILPEYYISELIITKNDFSSEYYLRNILNTVPFSENQKKRIIQNFISKSIDLEINNIISLINVFLDFEIIIEIEQIDFFKNLNISLNTFINIINLLKNLKNNNYCNLEQQINVYLDNTSSDNSKILLEVIKNTNSIILLEKAIKKCNSISNSQEYLELLINNDLVNKVSPELLYDNLSNYISICPIKILGLSLKFLSKDYDLFAKQITLNKQVIIDFYELLINNEIEIKQLTKSNCDLNTLTFFHFAFTEKINIQSINDLFRKYNYDFQSLIIKFYFKQFKLNKLSKSQVISILNSIECIELSSLMIKKFIITNINNRDELMNLMNEILKAHFKLLSEKNLNDTTFKNIFSLENLVKMCDGRKSYLGTTFWKGGNNTRFYTNGNHYISSGQKENMFCEGRFWNSQPFYNSDTNKPTTEQYNFYWCKNSYCAGVNDIVDLDLPFYKWTLLEINELFQIKLDRLAFVHFAGWLNRMQSIFDRMKCKDCNNYLRPKAFTPHLLGYYAVPLFICANEQCISFNKEIRFTHCRGCSKILDSRECKVCSSCKWLICDDENCSKCGCGSNHNSVYAQYS